MITTKGKKTKARISGTLKIKKWLAEQGVISCELKFPGCVGKFTAALAHDDKGRFMSAEELADPDPERVIIACSSCHYIIEHEMKREAMQALVREVAKSRFNFKGSKILMQKKQDKINEKDEKKKRKSNGPAVPDICPKCHYQTYRLFSCPNCGNSFVK